MYYLVAYDIADPGRLRQVATVMERYGVRVQKSVFSFYGSPSRLNEMKVSVHQCIDVHEDKVQVWPVTETLVTRRWDAGTALPGKALCVVIGASGGVIIEDLNP